MSLCFKYFVDKLSYHPSGDLCYVLFSETITQVEPKFQVFLHLPRGETLELNRRL